MGSTVKAKKEAVDQVAKLTDSQCRLMLHQIATLRPSIITVAYEQVHHILFSTKNNALEALFFQIRASEPVIERVILRLARIHGKIACIKFHRALTHSGLKESKEYVESVCSAYGDIQILRFPFIKEGMLSSVSMYESVEDCRCVSLLTSYIFAKDNTRAYNEFISHFNLEDSVESIQLFGRFLRAMYIID